MEVECECEFEWEWECEGEAEEEEHEVIETNIDNIIVIKWMESLVVFLIFIQQAYI